MLAWAGMSMSHDYCQSDKSPSYFEMDLEIRMVFLNMGL